jgi:hypothetical protein
MTRRKDDKKLPNPLGEEQRRTIFELCRYAKTEDILQPWQRKFLYQAGIFDEWFANRFGLILSILQELLSDLPSGEEHKSETELRTIIEVVASVDAGEGGNFSGIHDLTVEVLNLERLVTLGKAKPQERLRLAEMYEEDGEKKKAKSIAKDLLNDFPENQTVIKLFKRLGGTPPKKGTSDGQKLVTTLSKKGAGTIKSTAKRIQTSGKIKGTQTVVKKGAKAAGTRRRRTV